MNLLSEVRRLEALIESRLRFLDRIRDKTTRGLYWHTMIEPYWRLEIALRQRLEN